MNKNMWNYLKMDSFGIEISFSKTKTAIINLLQQRNMALAFPTETQVMVKSKLLSLDIDFFIVFQFNGEKLISISMSPDTALDGDALYARYNKIQIALSNELGHPHNRWRTIMNWLDPDNRLAYWQSNGVRIEHYLLNRFGIEEVIDIQL